MAASNKSGKKTMKQTQFIIHTTLTSLGVGMIMCVVLNIIMKLILVILVLST